jgi:Ca2+-binding EF-hand superfamily protein
VESCRYATYLLTMKPAVIALTVLCSACAAKQPLSLAEQCRLLQTNSSRIIAQLDRNRDGKLDEAEFRAGIPIVDQTTEFKRRDPNSNGYIELGEMARVPAWAAGTGNDVVCHR